MLIEVGQFSLGNSFWIHPLVELFVSCSLCIFCCMVSGIFFWWRARPVSEGGLRLIWDMAAVMILPVLWYHDIVCDVMPWYRVCDVMSWYRVCDVMPWYRVCDDVMSIMISGMWWCHAHVIGIMGCQVGISPHHAMIVLNQKKHARSGGGQFTRVRSGKIEQVLNSKSQMLKLCMQPSFLLSTITDRVQSPLFWW